MKGLQGEKKATKYKIRRLKDVRFAKDDFVSESGPSKEISKSMKPNDIKTDAEFIPKEKNSNEAQNYTEQRENALSGYKSAEVQGKEAIAKVSNFKRSKATLLKFTNTIQKLHSHKECEGVAKTQYLFENKDLSSGSLSEDPRYAFESTSEFDKPDLNRKIILQTSKATHNVMKTMPILQKAKPAYDIKPLSGKVHRIKPEEYIVLDNTDIPLDEECKIKDREYIDDECKIRDREYIDDELESKEIFAETVDTADDITAMVPTRHRWKTLSNSTEVTSSKKHDSELKIKCENVPSSLNEVALAIRSIVDEVYQRFSEREKPSQTETIPRVTRIEEKRRKKCSGNWNNNDIIKIQSEDENFEECLINQEPEITILGNVITIDSIVKKSDNYELMDDVIVEKTSNNELQYNSVKKLHNNELLNDVVENSLNNELKDNAVEKTEKYKLINKELEKSDNFKLIDHVVEKSCNNELKDNVLDKSKNYELVNDGVEKSDNNDLIDDIAEKSPNYELMTAFERRLHNFMAEARHKLPFKDTESTLIMFKDEGNVVYVDSQSSTIHEDCKEKQRMKPELWDLQEFVPDPKASDSFKELAIVDNLPEGYKEKAEVEANYNTDSALWSLFWQYVVQPLLKITGIDNYLSKPDENSQSVAKDDSAVEMVNSLSQTKRPTAELKTDETRCNVTSSYVAFPIHERDGGLSQVNTQAMKHPATTIIEDLVSPCKSAKLQAHLEIINYKVSAHRRQQKETLNDEEAKSLDSNPMDYGESTRVNKFNERGQVKAHTPPRDNTRKREQKQNKMNNADIYIWKPNNINDITRFHPVYPPGMKPSTTTTGVQTDDSIENSDSDDIFDDNKLDILCVCHDEEVFRPTLTGLFVDKNRRTDFVLVMRSDRDRKPVEVIKIEYLTGLVKAGLQLEAEDSVVHKNLTFIKLYATDQLLVTYGEAFGVKKPFRDYHEKFVDESYSPKWWNINEYEMLVSIRDSYKRPFKMSTYDRSYVVYMLLLYQSFGESRNYYGLNKLLKKRIVLDAFALHDGPYQTRGKENFNARQVLYTYWTGCINIFSFQPKHIIFEYFGPKLGFYFTFYELYIKVLMIASLWGIFMMIMYQIKDGDYFRHIRNHTCNHINMLDPDFLAKYFELANDDNLYSFYLTNTRMGSECEGHSEIHLCPYTLTQQYCFDLQIMRYFDSPYIIWYSTGMSILALLFLNYWKQTEFYWAWMVEESTTNDSGNLLLLKKYYKCYPKNCCVRCMLFVFRWIRHIIYRCLTDIVLPFLVIVIPLAVISLAFILGYTRTRPLSSVAENLTSSTTTDPLEVVIPKIDRHMEYAVLMATVFFVHLLLFLCEKIFHHIAYRVTKSEEHKTYESFEKGLVLCLFWISVHFTFDVTMYFAFMKGAFFHTPISYWDVVFNINIPGSHTPDMSFNMTFLLDEYWSKVLRRAFSMNCGPFSCFRHAVVVYFAVVFFRVVLVNAVCFIWSSMKIGAHELLEVLRKHKNLPTCDQEYSLNAVSERQVMMDYNCLLLQFAMVFLFAPLFPLAPLLAFIVNIWRIRSQAHTYLVHGRRTIFHRARGIGSWNEILKFICYAVPLFHAIIVARTEIFQKYIFHKVYSRMWIINTMPTNIDKLFTMNTFDWNPADQFLKFIFSSNYIQSFLMLNHPRFLEINVQKRVYLESVKPHRSAFIIPETKEVVYIIAYRSKLNGYFTLTHERDELAYTVPLVKYIWPYEHAFMEENYSLSSPSPHHYEWHFYKALYVLIFVAFFAMLAVCLHRYVGEDLEVVERRLARERQLLRVRRHRLVHYWYREETRAPAPLLGLPKDKIA